MMLVLQRAHFFSDAHPTPYIFSRQLYDHSRRPKRPKTLCSYQPSCGLWITFCLPCRSKRTGRRIQITRGRPDSKFLYRDRKPLHGATGRAARDDRRPEFVGHNSDDCRLGRRSGKPTTSSERSSNDHGRKHWNNRHEHDCGTRSHWTSRRI